MFCFFGLFCWLHTLLTTLLPTFLVIIIRSKGRILIIFARRPQRYNKLFENISPKHLNNCLGRNQLIQLLSVSIGCYLGHYLVYCLKFQT
ncbi:hypothetical protein BX600DRAFT_285619 [Xylariales sp. PMI_506]|nr:hypothetical protein BX600DRAFT_285619 [Xylariales sp. PMI_506]